MFDQPASYLTLFSSPDTYLNGALATQYGLPAARGWRRLGSATARAAAPGSCRMAACSPRSASSPTRARPSAASSCRRACSVTSVRPPPANVNVDQPPPGTDVALQDRSLRRAPDVGKLRRLPQQPRPDRPRSRELRHRRALPHARRRPRRVHDRRRRRASRLWSVQRPGELGQKAPRIGQARAVLRAAPSDALRGRALAASRRGRRGRSLSSLLQGVGLLADRSHRSATSRSDRFALRQEDPVQ